MTQGRFGKLVFDKGTLAMDCDKKEKLDLSSVGHKGEMLYYLLV